ncbi:MAG: glycoside hydrolase family 104 protein [Deltaproteobacteria bacterium]|nr:glycoside hydrolase family 104 protein [Deltaproteobacteria bacterium]
MRAIAAASLLLVPMFACAPPADDEPAPAPDARIVVEASPDSQRALGVTRWAVDPRGSNGAAIVGYDRGGRRVVVFEHAIAKGDVFEASLSRDASIARVVIGGAGEASIDEIGADPAARAALSRIAADLEASGGRGAQTSLLGARSASALRPQAEGERASLLERRGVCLSRICGSSLTKTGAAGARTALVCTEERARANECALQMKETKQKGKVSTSDCAKDREPAPPPASSQGSCDPALAAGAVTPMERALLDTIAYTEGTAGSCENDGYDTGFGYHCFASCASHPNVVWSGSSAAGRYQFLDFTWAGLGKSDFGPRNQDIAAMDLVRRRGVTLPQDRPLDEEEFDAAMRKLSYEWASLPYSPYGQPTKTLDDTRAHYCAFAGCDCHATN